MRNLARELELFDCNCQLGRYNHFQEGSFYTKEKLLEVMSHYEIKEALVYHALAKENYPLEGNPVLFKELKGEKRLHKCVVLMPPYTPEMGDIKKEIRSAIKNGAEAVRVCPNSHIYSYFTGLDDGFYAYLEELRIPLLLDFDTQFPFMDNTNWNFVTQLCADYKELPIILVHTGFRIDRYIYPMLKKYENLHLEMDGYWLYRAVESLCKETDRERILFGTFLPVYDPAITVYPLIMADVDFKTKKMVAGDNLRRLIRNIKRQ